MGSIGAIAIAMTASVALCCACGCGDSSAKQQVADPSLYEPKIVQEAPTKPSGAAHAPPSPSGAAHAPPSPSGAAHAPPRTLKPAIVSGVAMAPQSLFDGKLQILVPQTFTQMSESEIASLFKGAARPDVVFQSADKEMFLVIAQLKDPMLPNQVKGAFERAKKGMLAAYPDCTKRSETLAEVDGRTWMRFDLDGEKRVMVAVSSLDGRTLRIEASFVSKPAPKLTEAVKKMWETAVVADGHS